MWSPQKSRKVLRFLSGALFLNSIVCFGLSIALTFSAPGPAYAEGVMGLNDAVDKGKVQASAKSVGSYSEVDLLLKNLTDKQLGVDILGSYFSPPPGSDSQRLGIAFTGGTNGDSVVQLNPKETKTVKAKSFCLDSGKSVPDFDEIFTFSGPVTDIKERPYLDKVLDWYRANPNASQYDVQNAIWSIESDHEGENYHYNDGAAAVLDAATGSADPLKDKIVAEKTRDDAFDKAKIALGTGLSSLFGSGSIATLTGDTPGFLKKIWGGFVDGIQIEPGRKELIDNLDVGNLESALIGAAPDTFEFTEKGKDIWDKGSKALDIFNDANKLFKDGYNDNTLQSVGLSTFMNAGAWQVADYLKDMPKDLTGMKSFLTPRLPNLDAIEMVVNLILPESVQDILPSNVTKQAIQSVGDVTKALAQALGSGEMKPINDYAEAVANGDKGTMLSGYAEIGKAFGDITAALELDGVVKTAQDFYDDTKRIFDTGAWKDVLWQGAQSLADEAKKSTNGARGVAEISEIAGHVYGTIETKGAVEGTKELAGQLGSDINVIYQHGDMKQISEGVADSAEAATGMIGTGVKETANLAGDYYENNGGVIGGVKEFCADVGRIARYSWLGETVASWF